MVGEYPSYISFVLNNDNSIVVMYDNTNAQLVFNNMSNLYKIKKGKIHINLMRSSKSTDFVSQNSIVRIEKQHSALMNLFFDKGQDQFVTIDGQVTVKNELSGLSLGMIKQQKLFSTNIGQYRRRRTERNALSRTPDRNGADRNGTYCVMK